MSKVPFLMQRHCSGDGILKDNSIEHMLLLYNKELAPLPHYRDKESRVVESKGQFIVSLSTLDSTQLKKRELHPNVRSATKKGE